MKEKTKIIISVIITFIVTISITVTASIVMDATDISFTSDKTDKTNVKDSLDELYDYSLNKYNQGFEDGVERCGNAYNAVVDSVVEKDVSYNATSTVSGWDCSYLNNDYTSSCGNGNCAQKESWCDLCGHGYDCYDAQKKYTYSCPNGGKLSGTKCVKKETVTTYKCVDGYTLNGTICTKN